MSLEIWFVFAFSSTALLVIPGPTILTVIGYSITHGAHANVPVVLAVAFGDATALLFFLLGLGALLTTSDFLFTAVKFAGGLYLLYLGIKLLRTGVQIEGIEKTAERASRWKLFLNTYLVTALNPKGIIFFVAFFPQFVTPTASATQQLWLLAITFLVLATINATVYALFAVSARRLFLSPRAQNYFKAMGGTLLSSAGVWALLAQKPT